MSVLPFYCPIESAIHPDLNVIEKHAITWLDDLKIFENPSHRNWILDSNSAEFYARIAPQAMAERLQTAVHWVYWGFAIDDSRCDGGITSSHTAKFVDMAARLIRILDSRQSADSFHDPYEKALAEITESFRGFATPTQLLRWKHAQRSWLFAVAWGVSRTETQSTVGIADYLAQRLNDCGGEPTTAMIEIVNGHEVPSAEMDSPAVIALTEATRMVAALDNDVVSHQKEIIRQEKVQNIISVIAREQRCTESDAAVKAMAIRDRIMSLFLRLREQILKHASLELRSYVDCLGHVIRGNIEWSLRVPRYHSELPKLSAQKIPTGLPIHWADLPSDCNPDPLPVPSITWWWEQLT